MAWTGFAHALLAALARFAETTPNIATLPALVAVWRVSLGLAAGLGALLVAIAGGLVAYPGSLPWRLPMREIALRALAAVLLATQSLALFGWAIGACNAIVAAFVGAHAVTAALSAPAPASGLIAFVLSVVPYMALLVVLAVVYAVRLVELVALAALAPLAAITAIHPIADGLLRAWAAEALAVLLLQPAQAVVLVLVQVALADLPGLTSAPATLVSTLALMYLTLRLPGWLRRVAHSFGQGQALAAIGLLGRLAAR
jgi:hypothetical protein